VSDKQLNDATVRFGKALMWEGSPFWQRLIFKEKPKELSPQQKMRLYEQAASVLLKTRALTSSTKQSDNGESA
jgi:hypothetical protein